MTELIPLLPHFQATLNLTTAILVAVAYFYILRRDKVSHRKYMVAALLVSTVFMISYLTYHYHVGYAKFEGVGGIRPVYFTILASHIILAALIIPLLLTTVTLALKANFKRHRTWARWTLPIWIYVSISGLVIYLMAFHIYAPQTSI